MQCRVDCFNHKIRKNFFWRKIIYLSLENIYKIFIKVIQTHVMESEFSQKAEPSACLGVRHLFVFLGELRLSNIDNATPNYLQGSLGLPMCTLCGWTFLWPSSTCQRRRAWTGTSPNKDLFSVILIKMYTKDKDRVDIWQHHKSLRTKQYHQADEFDWKLVTTMNYVSLSKQLMPVTCFCIRNIHCLTLTQPTFIDIFIDVKHKCTRK